MKKSPIDPKETRIYNHRELDGNKPVIANGLFKAAMNAALSVEDIQDLLNYYAMDPLQRKLLENKKEALKMKPWAVTGTFHGSYVVAKSEGEARRKFHEWWNGESILYIKRVL